MRTLLEVDGHWLPSHRADPRGYALYKRHYSAKKNAHLRRVGTTNFIGSGRPMVLLTADCKAVFAWLENTVERLDHEQGICCTVFHNESPVLSSLLIGEADDLAWQKWPGQRHFTYVDIAKTAGHRSKSAPVGKCFIEAGWTDTGRTSADGSKVILERLPIQLTSHYEGEART